MTKHNHHHHHHHIDHGHPHHDHRERQIQQTVQSLRDMRASPEEIRGLLQPLCQEYGVQVCLELAPEAIAAKLGEAIAARQAACMAALRGAAQARPVLIAGQCPPHVMDELLAAGLHIIQLHPPHLHAQPPHVAHLQRKHGHYEYAEAIEHLLAQPFGALVIHGFHSAHGVLVAPVAAVAARLWHVLPLASVRARHPAPHHQVSLPAMQAQFFLEE